MMDYTISQIIAFIFVILGIIVLTISAIGVIKFPDFYTRLHASSVGETMGTLLILIGMMILLGWQLLSLKIFLIFVIVCITNPLGTHLIMMQSVHHNNYLNYNTKKEKL